MSGDNAKEREDVTAIEWHGELDSHLSDLDSRLTRTRRRAGVLPDPVSMRSTEARDASEGGPPRKPGTVLIIRFRMPRLPWPFRWLQRRRRRREHPLTTAKVRV